jgi:hypothetical protein
MRRWPWLLIGVLFLLCDLFVAGLVYARLDPGAAHTALRRLNLVQEPTSAPGTKRPPTGSSAQAASHPRLVDVHRSPWRVDKWQPRTRVEIGVGDSFTWPDHRTPGRQYLILRVYEASHAGGSSHFASSARHFALHDSDKTDYGETQAFFSRYKMPRMQEFTDLLPGGKNIGGIAFDIANRRGTYVVLWRESKAATWLPIAQVAVGPGHRPIVSPSS